MNANLFWRCDVCGEEFPADLDADLGDTIDCDCGEGALVARVGDSLGEPLFEEGGVFEPLDDGSDFFDHNRRMFERGLVD